MLVSHIEYHENMVLCKIGFNQDLDQFPMKNINRCSAKSRHESRSLINLNNTIFIVNSKIFAILLILFCRDHYSYFEAFQSYLQCKTQHVASLTVFPAPFGPTKIVNGLKKVIICLSLSSTPKLLTPRILIFSIFDISAELLLFQSQKCKCYKSCKIRLREKSRRQKLQHITES